MILNNYKITKEPEEGIWISYKELDEIMAHFDEVGKKYSANEGKVGDLKAMYYFGKRDLCIDLLKHFDQLEGE